MLSHLARRVLPVSLLVVLVSCAGEDRVTTESQSLNNARILSLAAENIGPSEIVFCLDVSDSISSGELDAILDALGDCLEDPSLVPADGRIGVAAVVYGDSVATILERTLVTPASLDSVILPALAGLSIDRVVGGGGADLSGGLTLAGAILQSSSLTDLHVLAVSSGEADDASAVEAACGALAANAVMISALGVGVDASGAAMLEECVDLTRGFFGAGSDDLGDLCAEALAYMLQVDLRLTPESEELLREEEHAARATIFRGGDEDEYPLEGLEIGIDVVEGPNAGVATTGMSDSSGAVVLSYQGLGGPGTDIIVASSNHPGTGVVLTDTASVTWLNMAPECDAGGPYTVVVLADTASVTLDGSGSSDAEDDSLTFLWAASCEDAWFDDDTSMNPRLYVTGACLCADSFTVMLTVSDGFDESSCEAVVYVSDKRPPVIELKDELPSLWPPNHKHEKIPVESTIARIVDACGNEIDLSQVFVVEVRSDEAEDARGRGDGSTREDIRIACPNDVYLRAERAGGGDGRVYTIVYRVIGENGVSADAEAKVVVPHDSSGKIVEEDAGGGYRVSGNCGGTS